MFRSGQFRIKYASYLFGVHRLSASQNQHVHRTRPWVHGSRSVPHTRLQSSADFNHSPGFFNILCCAACAYPLQLTFAREALAGMRADLDPPATICRGAWLLPLSLLKHSEHNALLASIGVLAPALLAARPVVNLGLGVACRDRVLSPRRASDDVIFDVCARRPQDHWIV